jgi:hypothetical protein
MIYITWRKFVLLFTTTLLFFVFASCKKNNSDDHSKTLLISQAEWKLVKDESKIGAGAWTDNSASHLPCEKDNITIFRTNGTYEGNEGKSKCKASDPQVRVTGTWSFESNFTQIKITITGSPVSEMVNIDHLDDSSLVTTYTLVSSGTTYYYRASFGH